MKNTFFLLFVLLVLFSCKQKNVDNNPRISELPDFESYCSDEADLVVLNNLESDITYVIFFSPECELCEDEIKIILDNRELCVGRKFIFITQPIMRDEMPYFLEMMPMNEIPNSVILFDSSMRFHTLFGVSSPPSTFVYDKKGQIVDSYHGFTHMDKLLRKKYGK